MTIHVFPSGREVADVREIRRDATRARSDRVERWLIAGLIVATAIQAALFAWFWLG